MKHRMRTRIASVMIGVLLAIGVPQTTHAKRRPPAEVKAVVKDGIRYSAPHFGALHGKLQNGGYVQAQETSSGKLLWDRMVYRVIHDARLERDAQDVFIVRVSVNEGTLLVENELGETFEMDLATGRCKAVIKKSTRTHIGTEAGRPR